MQKSKYVAVFIAFFLVMTTFGDCKPAEAGWFMEVIKSFFIKSPKTVKTLPKYRLPRTAIAYTKIESFSSFKRHVPDEIKELLEQSGSDAALKKIQLNAYNKSLKVVGKIEKAEALAAADTEGRKRGYYMNTFVLLQIAIPATDSAISKYEYQQRTMNSNSVK